MIIIIIYILTKNKIIYKNINLKCFSTFFHCYFNVISTILIANKMLQNKSTTPYLKTPR